MKLTPDWVVASLFLVACGGSDVGSGTGTVSGTGAAGGATGLGADGGNAGGATSAAGGTSDAANGGATSGAGGSVVGAGGSANGGGAGGSLPSTGGSTTATGGATSHPCASRAPIPVGDGVDTSPGDSGFDRCADGAIRRRKAVTCPYGPSAATSPCIPPDGTCASDAECTASPHGLCANAHKLLGYCGCFYGCMKDADCDPGSVCFCGDPVGSCIPATCVDDSACALGLVCASSSASCSGGMSAFACQQAADECLGDADCGTDRKCELQGTTRVCVSTCILPPTP